LVPTRRRKAAPEQRRGCKLSGGQWYSAYGWTAAKHDGSAQLSARLDSSASSCVQPVQRRLALIVRGPADHQPPVRILKRHEHLEVDCDHTGVGMPHHLPPTAVDLDVSFGPQPCEVLVARDQFGDECGQLLILRMRSPRGAQVGDALPEDAFAVDVE